MNNRQGMYILRRKPLDRPEVKNDLKHKKDCEAYVEEYQSEFSIKLTRVHSKARMFERDVGLAILKTINSVRWELLPAV